VSWRKLPWARVVVTQRESGRDTSRRSQLTKPTGTWSTSPGSLRTEIPVDKAIRTGGRSPPLPGHRLGLETPKCGDRFIRAVYRREPRPSAETRERAHARRARYIAPVPLLQAAFVAGSALVAGIMNAIAGGGTLLSFPALLLVGLSPVTANATSTVALWPGQLSSAWAYRGHIQEERHRAIVLGVPAVLGGALGSALLLLLPESSFAAVVPWLILFACALLALQEPIKRAVTGHAKSNHPAVLWGIQFLISIYGGYFGAGIGILMLAAMGILIPSSMQHANALKILLALLTNGTACVLFTLSGKVNFQVAALMTVASLVGGWAGALLAKRLSPALMRGFAVVIGLAAAAKFLLS